MEEELMLLCSGSFAPFTAQFNWFTFQNPKMCLPCDIYILTLDNSRTKYEGQISRNPFLTSELVKT